MMKQLGPYLLEEKLGQGGMAEVFKARSFGASGFERTVVLKTLRAEWVGAPEMERMFFEEARLQALLHHRALVQAHDVGIDQGRPWVRLDYVDGCDIGRLTLPLPEGIVRHVMAELALGLQALHEATDLSGRPLGIVHRDISPKNILLSTWGEVRLADFGIARATHLHDQTRAGIRKGTHSYMSPEQVRGEPLTAASDQFALASVAYELLTGARAFEGETPFQTMEKVREVTRPLLPSPATGWAAVFDQAWEKEPQRRFSSALALRTALLSEGVAAEPLALGLLVREQRRSPASTRPPTVATDGAATRPGGG
jgi:eukaryotic-like serine/threonine-protein kinase